MKQSDSESAIDRMRDLIAIEVNRWAQQLPYCAPEVVAAFNKGGKSGVEQFLNEQAARMKARVFHAMHEFSPAAASSLAKRHLGQG